MITYDPVYNAAYCEECAAKNASGEILIDNTEEFQSITLDQLRDMWSNEEMPTCSWCGVAFWEMVDFYDLPTGRFFKAVRIDRNRIKRFWSETYHKISQGTAVDIHNPAVTYYGSDFYRVVEVPTPTK